MSIIFRVNWLLTRQSFVTSLLLHPKPHSIMYSTPGILAWQMRLHFLLNVCRIHRVSLTFNSNTSHCEWIALFCAEREIKTVRTIYIMKFTWELPHQTHSLLLFLFVIIVRRRPLVDFVWKEGNLICEYFPPLLCMSSTTIQSVIIYKMSTKRAAFQWDLLLFRRWNVLFRDVAFPPAPFAICHILCKIIIVKRTFMCCVYMHQMWGTF